MRNLVIGQGDVEIRVIRNGSDLMPHRLAWERLASRALEPNVYYEPGPFLTAVSNPGTTRMPTVVLIYERTGDQDPADALIGFFPFLPAHRGPRRLIKYYRLWISRQCSLCTPLVDQKRAVTAIDAILDWMDGVPEGVRFFGLFEIGVDGPFARLLHSRLDERHQPYHLEQRYHRAVFRPGESGSRYISAAVSVKRRKEYRRLRNRLKDLGKVEFVSCRPADPIAPWVDAFLALERKGWKGKLGSAMGSTNVDERFFRRLITEAHARGKVMMFSLLLDKRPIAMKWDLLSAQGGGYGFAFRITYDEEFARYSPGVLLELEAIDLLHHVRPRITWVDSCALPKHTMIEGLWTERREIGSISCGSRGFAARSVIRAIALKQRVRPPELVVHMGPRQYPQLMNKVHERR